MYNRIKACLVAPGRIADYLDEKIRYQLLFLLVMIILYALPTILILTNVTNISSAINSNIAQVINQNDVDYAIVDNTLVKLSSSTDEKIVNGYVTISNLQADFDVVFSLDGAFDETKLSKGGSLIFVFKEKELNTYLSVSMDATSNPVFVNLSSKSYSDLGVGNINFYEDDIATLNYSFSIVFDAVYKNIVKDNIVLFIVGDLIVTSHRYMIQVLIVAAFAFLILRMIKVKFSKAFRAAIYSSFPLVVFNLIGTLLGISFLTIIGEIIMVFYVYRALVGYGMKNKLKSAGIDIDEIKKKIEDELNKQNNTDDNSSDDEPLEDDSKEDNEKGSDDNEL